MLYETCKGLALRVLKTPAQPPEPPAGSHASVQIFRASPRYLDYRLLLYWIGVGLLWATWWAVLVAALLEGELGGFVVAALLAPVYLFIQLLCYFTTRIDFELRYYVVTDRSIRVRQGALIVREMTVTHANVQNLRLVQGPIQKLFGLWTLRVDTAGGGAAQGQHATGHAVEFAGIDNAHEVRDSILGYLKQHGKGAGLGDPDDHDHRSTFSPCALDLLRSVRDSAALLRRAAEGAP